MQTLRPYQIAACDAVHASWNAGKLDTLLVAATGAGKTQVFLSILMDELDRHPDARALVIAHRQELIDQPVERIGKMRPDWLSSGVLERPRVGIMMGAQNAPDRQLTIGTVQSFISERRRSDLLRFGQITHLVVDECHHATANTYMDLYRQLREHNPQLRHLGVTATPMRADGDGLSKVYQDIAYKITIADLVKQGFLVQPRWLAIETKISLAGVHSRAGDFVQSELAQRFDTDNGRRIIVDAYQKYAAGRRTIAFTASVAGAHALADAFVAAGVSARAVDGQTDKETRKQIMSDFRAGRFDILCNCQVATEGFDAPGTSCVLMCRPTKSDALYIQCMGRGLRPALGMAQPGEDCIILDFAPEDTRNIVMAGNVLGIPKELADAVMQNVNTDELDEGDVIAGFTYDGERFDTGGTPLEIIHRELNYLEQSDYIWHRRESLMTLGLGASSDGLDRILTIVNGKLYGLRRPARSRDDWQVIHIKTDDPYTKAQELAQQYASGALAGKNRAWHKAPASDGQCKYLKRLAGKELKQRDIERLDKRAAAELITYYQTRAALRETGVLS